MQTFVIVTLVFIAAHIQTFSFRFNGQNFGYGPRIPFTHDHQGGHVTEGGGEEEHVVVVAGDDLEGASDVTAHTEGAELLIEVVAVG